MTEDQQELIEKARSSLAAAKWLLEGAYPDFAASRVYYAMFYIAQAFLEGEGLAFSKHSGVSLPLVSILRALGKFQSNFIAIFSQPKTYAIVATMVHRMP